MNLERLFFKKVEIWVVLLLLVLAIISAIIFGWKVDTYHKENARPTTLTKILREIAILPEHISTIFKHVDSGAGYALISGEERFEGMSGFTFNYEKNEYPELSYILINRYDGDQQLAVSDLVDLASQEVVHQWRYDVDPIWSEIESNYGQNLQRDSNTARFRNIHAYLHHDGLITTQGNTPLITLDLCSDFVTFVDGIFHHTIEADAEGNLWVPSRLMPKTVDLGGEDFMDDAITKISPDGKILFQKSVTSIFDENEMAALVYAQGRANDDPIHLNDIEPVLNDGLLWKKGDIFLSMRHQSMVALYRPSNNKVIWYKVGPWLHQHDVDVISDSMISVFNNNSVAKNYSTWTLRGNNEENIYDFQTNTLSSPFKSAFELLDIKTVTGGLADVVDGDKIFVEESNYGRLIMFEQTGNTLWQYINRANDGNIYMLNASRLISREVGDKVRALINEEQCSAN